MSLLSFPRCRVAEGTGTFDILQLPWETLLPGAGVPQGLHAAGMLQGFLLRGQRWLSFSPWKRGWVSYHPTQRCPGPSICQRRDERSAPGGQCSGVSYPRGMRAGRDEGPRGSTAVPREHCWFCRTPLPAAPAAPAQSQPRAGARRASSPHRRDGAAPGAGAGEGEGRGCVRTPWAAAALPCRGLERRPCGRMSEPRRAVVFAGEGDFSHSSESSGRAGGRAPTLPGDAGGNVTRGRRQRGGNSSRRSSARGLNSH